MLKPNRRTLRSVAGGLVVISIATAAVFAWNRAKQGDVHSEAVRLAAPGPASEAAEVVSLRRQLQLKDEALALATQQNFQQELIQVQGSLREASDRLNAAVRDKSVLENTKLNLEGRLKNTTTELTNTLTELKKSREAIGGIDGQNRTKIDQVSMSVRLKDQELARLSDRLKEKESALTVLLAKEQEARQGAREAQMKVVELEKTVGSLNHAIAQKEVEIARAASGAGKERPSGTAAAQGAGLEKEKTTLENQVAQASARLFDQQETLKGLENKVAELTSTLANKDAEVALARRTAEGLKVQLEMLRNGSSSVAATGETLSASSIELEAKVRLLERQKDELLAKVGQLERAPSTGKSARDPFADRNFRILTETLVKKEETIAGLERELKGLREYKNGRAGGDEANARRMAELEILVTTLTKQLGDYSASIEAKDRELRRSADHIAELMDEVEAQKTAAVSIQKELAESRMRQEKTFQSLTQVMGLNAGASSGDASSYSTSVNAVTPDPSGPAPDDKDAQRRTEKLRRQVEVLLQSKGDVR
jgi:chromosome segregation ATPase